MSAPLVPPAAAGAATAETSVYGVRLFKPFTAMPECPEWPQTAPGMPKMYASAADTPQPCFQHTDDSQMGQAPAGTEMLYIEFPLAKRPEMYNGLRISLIHGVVNGIYLVTLGIETQAHDYALLEGKFGPPVEKRTVTVQNKMGASFQVIEATWQRPEGVSLSFRGAGNSLDAGELNVTTPQERARKQAALHKQQEGVPKL